MLINKCPGQDRRNIKIETLGCYNCGYQVEMFSDEVKVKCPSCRFPVVRAIMPTCVDWCNNAWQCVGEEKWIQLRGGS